MLITTMTKQAKNKNLNFKHALELLITLLDMENEKGKGKKRAIMPLQCHWKPLFCFILKPYLPLPTPTINDTY
jgi:hypothetical protein